MARRHLHIVILAAGEGKRMRSPLPKVLLDLMGIPVVSHVLAAARGLKPQGITVVGGKRLAEIKAALRDEADLEFVRQPSPRGTAHAVRFALPKLPRSGPPGDVMILNGDGPLVTTASLQATLERHRLGKKEVTVVSAHVAEPRGLGRIVRDSEGRFERIVEEKDATDVERRIGEINAGQYVVDRGALFELLPRIGKKNAQGEYYLTDLVSLATRVDAVPLADPEEARGLNDPQELAEVRGLMRRRILSELQMQGVQVPSPDLTYVEARVSVGAGSVLHPFVVVRTGVSIGTLCSVGPLVVVPEGTRLPDGAAMTAPPGVTVPTLEQGSGPPKAVRVSKQDQRRRAVKKTRSSS